MKRYLILQSSDNYNYAIIDTKEQIWRSLAERENTWAPSIDELINTPIT